MNLNLTPLLTQAYKAFQSGQLDIAQGLAAKVLSIQSNNFDALYLSGVIHGIKGQHDIAAKQLKKAVALKPQHPFAHFNLAKALMEQGRDRDAIDHLKKSLRLEPNNSDAELNLGLCLLKLTDYSESLKHFDRVLKLNPQSIEAMVNKITCLLELHISEEALDLALLTTQLSPQNDTCWAALGSTYFKLKNPSEALASYQKALELDPNNFKYHLNVGKCWIDLEEADNAKAAYLTTLELNPNHVDCLTSLAVIHINQHQFDMASPLLQRAIEKEPEDINSHVNLGILNLINFNFSSGWKESEHRDLKRLLLGGAFDTNRKKQWKPNDTKARLLIWGEQGLGDQVLYSSILHDTSAIVKNIQVGIDERLISLLNRSYPNINFFSAKNRPEESTYDCYLPIASLGQFFRSDVEKFPIPISFLKADENKIFKFKSLLPENKLVCGLSWSSKNNNFSNAKSLSANKITTLLGISDTQFINLQYSPELDDLKILEQYPSTFQTLDSLDPYNDLDSLAAAIMACDVVITISNTTAHISGALGKETLLLLPYGVGKFWYWNEYQGRNLWYPNIKVFQQKIEGDWSHPLAELQKYLEQKIA
jgi:tetratricopeptide (TPR) repeat protein